MGLLPKFKVDHALREFDPNEMDGCGGLRFIILVCKVYLALQVVFFVKDICFASYRSWESVKVKCRGDLI